MPKRRTRNSNFDTSLREENVQGMFRSVILIHVITENNAIVSTIFFKEKKRKRIQVRHIMQINIDIRYWLTK